MAVQERATVKGPTFLLCQKMWLKYVVLSSYHLFDLFALRTVMNDRAVWDSAVHAGHFSAVTNIEQGHFMLSSNLLETEYTHMHCHCWCLLWMSWILFVSFSLLIPSIQQWKETWNFVDLKKKLFYTVRCIIIIIWKKRVITSLLTK